MAADPSAPCGDAQTDAPEQASALAALKAELSVLLSQLPDSMRSQLPTDSAGESKIEIVYGLFRYENTAPGEVEWVEVRELSLEEWEAAVKAHSEIYRRTQDVDRFPAFAWGELLIVRDELLRQLLANTHPDEWVVPLLEYRILNFSTAVKLYHEHITATVNRTKNEDLKNQVASAFSQLYDTSLGYRISYSMRNAFLHEGRALLSLQMTARLVDGSNTEKEAEAHAYLDKDAFGATGTNATVRKQVRESDGDLDLLELGEEAFTGLQELHAYLSPLLHPNAPAAAQLLSKYIKEAGWQVAHFHEYIRGLPTRGVLDTRTLDRLGFEYVAHQAGVKTSYEGAEPLDLKAALPTYPQARPAT